MYQKVKQLIHKLTSLPPEKLAQVNDFIDYLSSKSDRDPRQNVRMTAFDFPVDHVGKWPDDLSLRRQDLYGDDGR